MLLFNLKLFIDVTGVQNETKKTRTTVFTAIAATELETWPEAESSRNMLVFHIVMARHS